MSKRYAEENGFEDVLLLNEKKNIVAYSLPFIKDEVVRFIKHCFYDLITMNTYLMFLF